MVSFWGCFVFFFFFQAEDGIRDRDVTGVQTCALPIFDVADNIHATFGILYLIVTVAPTLISKVSKVWLLDRKSVV